MFAANVDDAMTPSRSAVGFTGRALSSLISFFGRPAQNDSMLANEHFLCHRFTPVYGCWRVSATVPKSLIKKIFRWNAHSIHMSFENQNIGQESVFFGSEDAS